MRRRPNEWTGLGDGLREEKGDAQVSGLVTGGMAMPLAMTQRRESGFRGNEIGFGDVDLEDLSRR